VMAQREVLGALPGVRGILPGPLTPSAHPPVRRALLGEDGR
jgi:hypothetical protein